MFEDFQNIFRLSLNFGDVAGNLLIAFLCGLIISVVYRGVYHGPNYSPKFVRSTVVLSMITGLVIMVIGNNLARAFGLVGAMSIIRFRTAVKDTQDIVFIFFSLAAGMASGVGLRGIAIGGTLLIGLVLFVLHSLRYGSLEKREFLLQFHSPLTKDPPVYLPLFRKYCRQNKMVNMHSVGTDLYELSFSIYMKDEDKISKFMKEMNNLPSLSNIRFFFDEE
jgi:uncharacterized membrane protein YhiD involved in acid resistance